MPITTFTDSDYSALFKRTYGEYADNMYGSGIEDPLESQIPKYFDFGGSEHRFPVKVGFGGGTSFGTLGAANSSKNVDVVLTRKSAYVRMNLNRETIVASRGKAAAFKEATQEETVGKVRSFTRTQAAHLYNDGTGILGQFTGPAGGSAAAPTATILTTGTYRFRQGFFEEGDYVNILVNGEASVRASVFEITNVDVSTRVVTLARISGSDDLTGLAAATHSIVLQNAYNVAPTGLMSAANFDSSTLFGVTYARRWSPYQDELTTASLISTELLNKMVLQMDQRAGEPPGLLIFSVKQMELFLNQLEDKKRYNTGEIRSRGNKMTTKADVSFSTIEYMGPRGVIPIVSSRYVRDDTIYAVNTSKMFRKHAEKFGWFDEDRTVLMRMQDEDAYEARYGGYYENYFNPLHVGKIDNLAVA